MPKKFPLRAFFLLRVASGLLIAHACAGADVDHLRGVIERFSAPGSRVVGYPGCALAADYVEAELGAIGVEDLRREEYGVVVPMDRGFLLTVEGRVFEIWSLWPNLVRTSTLPAEGVRAPMIYGGHGDWSEFNGRQVEGRIALLEFNSEDRWLHAAALGARAVIFIEPESSTWRQANDKFVEAPLDIPRFWIGRNAGLSLLQRLRQGGEVEGLLRGRMDWEERPAWNIVGRIAGAHPELNREIIVVEAYYDGTSVVPALAPSAEAACSITALLELARHLKAHPPARTVVLAATSAHFQAMQGMVDFLERHARLHEDYVGRVADPLQVKLFISLDLSSQSDLLGLWNSTHNADLRRFYAPFGRRFTAYARQMAPLLGRHGNEVLVNGISPIKGLGWSSFVPQGAPVNSEMAHAAGIVSLAFVTVHDGRFNLDTPLDRPGKVNLGNLERQIALLQRILHRALDDPELFAGMDEFGQALKDRLRDLRLEVRTFPPRSQLPDRAVAGALAAIRPADPHQGRGTARQDLGLEGTRQGVRRWRYHICGTDGNAEIRGLPQGMAMVSAYGLEPKTGSIVLAPDLSIRAQDHHGEPADNGSLQSSIRFTTNKKTLVLFEAVQRPLFSLLDPRFLLPMQNLKILDAGGRDARRCGYALSPSPRDLVGVVFGPPGRAYGDRLKIIVNGGLMLLVNSQGTASEKEARGIGYLLAEEELTRTTVLALRDMWQLTEARLRTMRRHAIENQRLTQLHAMAGSLMEEAEEAGRARQWDRHVAGVRAALGTESRVYPDALVTLNDVIKGMVFFLALVIPAAFFAERLFLAAADIRRQLAGFALLLLFIWVVISQVHPAFEIAHPLVLLLAFAIMAMAVFVLLLVVGRFNRHMRDYQAIAAQVHETDISRVGAAYAAFMLGISNMRRRKLRTGLTLTTLVLLTFTVLSFSSFKNQIRFMGFPLGKGGAYSGALIRNWGWEPLELAALEYVRSHFESHGIVSPRSWFILQGGEEKGYITVTSGKRSVRAGALLGLAPQEEQIGVLDAVLRAGTWFEEAGESTCLVPVEMAALLGIAEEDVGRARVSIFGRQLLLRGLVDSNRLALSRDLDGGMATPADFHLSVDQTGAAAVGEDPRGIRPFVHQRPETVLVVPYELARQMGGDLRSVAVRFHPEVEARDLIEDFLLRQATSLFAGLEEEDGINVYSYTSVGMTVVEGLGQLIVPVIIAALIVLNTMVGAVHERSREIGIYSSVGLAPAHISMLFVAEACVYAVLGIAGGYVLGQSMGKALIWANFLEGVNLNYSSLSAVVAALLVMAVVLLSTLYPARMAAQAAVPEVVRRWQLPAPEGDRWEFPFPFMVGKAEVEGLCGFLVNYFRAYSEESLGTFFTEEIRLVRESGARGEEYAVQMLIWLAPFDMGVSQYLQIVFEPTEVENIYAAEFFIQRVSGQDTFWRSTNQRFVHGLRKEFLIWHTLKDEEREQHMERARQMLGEGIAMEGG